MKLYGIVGAGGFGREVMPLAEHWVRTWDNNGKNPEVVFVVENNYPISQKIVNGHRVIRMYEFLAAPVSDRRFHIAVGHSAVRDRIAGSIPANLATRTEESRVGIRYVST